MVGAGRTRGAPEQQMGTLQPPRAAMLNMVVDRERLPLQGQWVHVPVINRSIHM